MTTSPSFFTRLSLALRSLFTITFQPEFAQQVMTLRQGQPAVPPATAPAPLRETAPEAALQLLGLLQREARFIDFIEEDIRQASDADIGAAARVVHGGCRKVLHDYFTVVPVRSEIEGQRITLPEGFDAATVRVTGNVVGSAPFTGTLCHRGWRVDETRLPRLVGEHDPAILAQAEVEL
ncbi:MAG: DUF2760 domain-containing protein [Rhodocyclaceae bacterium]|nr:DUF2760 domain-containing protein [Rhodocyclaceae bacterium]